MRVVVRVFQRLECLTMSKVTKKKSGLIMTISFVRIDDRMIHGQTVTRWAKEIVMISLLFFFLKYRLHPLRH